MEIVYTSDQELIQACRQGDIRAWEHVLDKYERLVFSIPLNCGLSQDDAADITQLTFTFLLQSLHTLRDDSHLGAWLAIVARRHSWRLLTHDHRESAGEYEQLPEHGTLIGNDHSESIEQWEHLEWLNHGLSQLDERCRDLLLALYFDPQQPAYAEVAARLGMAVGSIGPTRTRCLERLKQILSEP